ncbi:MAG: hypothetical protein QF864_01540, partial [SAR202 cluster bacterium]|nr:hypothetical protein [SAR202 cluster bacterium]
IPSDLDSDTAVIQLVNFSDKKHYYYKKTSLKKIKSSQDASFTEKYIPINFIDKIYVGSDEIIEKFNQMEFSDTIDYDDGLFDLDEQLYLKKDESGKLKIELETLLKSLSKKERKHNSSEEYNHFENMVTFHLLTMNYVFENNLYCAGIDSSLPKSFKEYYLQDKGEYKFIKCLQNIGLELFDANNEGKVDSVFIENLSEACEDSIKIEEIFLWMAIIRELRDIPGSYKVEESDDLYIDNNRQYLFTIDSFKSIGKKYQNYLTKYFLKKDQSLSEDNIKKQLRSDTIMRFLSKLAKEYENLDFTSHKILEKLKSSDDIVFESSGIFLHDLIRYGDDISIFLKKLHNLDLSRNKQDLLTGILYANYIGLPMLPKGIKQCDNSKFLWSSINSDQILCKHKITKTGLWDQVTKWFSDPIYLDEDNRFIRFGGIRYEVLFESMEETITEEENLINAILPLKNDFGFIFYHRESVKVAKLDFGDLTMFTRYMKKHYEPDFNQYILNFEKELSLFERMKFHLFNNRKHEK